MSEETPTHAGGGCTPSRREESTASGSQGFTQSVQAAAQQAWSALGTALNLSPHPQGRRNAPPSTGRSRTPVTQFATPRTKGHDAMLITMMSLDSDIQDMGWADRMLCQLDPITEGGMAWRVAYSEDMIRELVDRAREILEVRVEPMASLPDLPTAPNLSISPTAPYVATERADNPIMATALSSVAPEFSTLSSSGGAALNTLTTSDIEEFGIDQPILAGEMCRCQRTLLTRQPELQR